MKILLSPAKRIEKIELKCSIDTTKNQFLNFSEELIDILKTKSILEISKLMNLSQNLSELNVARYQTWNKKELEKNGFPAIQLFKGDAYKSMKVKDFNLKELNNLKNSLLIISGLYGLIKPFDKILPYRLEMGTKLENKKGKNLYDFWKNILTESLNSEAKNHVILNLASKEYSKAINFKKIMNEVYTFDFLQEENNNYKNIAIYAKQARGLMCRFIAKNNITKIRDLRAFDLDNYTFNRFLSKNNHLVFSR